jgi:hypothetical protein
MRFSEHSNPDTFVKGLEKFEQRFMLKCESLTTTVVDSPNFLENYLTELKIPKFNKDKLLALCYLSNFAGDLRFWLQESIEKELSRRYNQNGKLDEKQETILFLSKILMSGKAQSRQFLIDTDLWTEREFFGNYLNEHMLAVCEKIIKFKRPSAKVKKPQRKRGYNDKGSRRPSHEKHEPEFADANLTKLHMEIELERQKESDMLALIQGFLD